MARTKRMSVDDKLKAVYAALNKLATAIDKLAQEVALLSQRIENLENAFGDLQTQRLKPQQKRKARK